LHLFLCAKFQAIPITGFRFIVLTCPNTNKPTHDKAIAMYAPTYYVGAYNNAT